MNEPETATVETPEPEPAQPAEPVPPQEPEPEPEPEPDSPDGPSDPDEPGPDAEHAPPVAPTPAGLNAEQADKIANDAARDWQRFKQRTIDRWEGEGEYLRDCPLCLDQHKGLVDLRHAGNYPREIISGVMGFLGLARERDYKQSGSHTPCSFCDANGKVATGSHVPEHVTVTCPECRGFGYTPPPTAQGTVVALPGVTAPPPPPPTADIETGDVDNWGEPKILPDGRPNPNFGRQPAYKVQVEPYGATAHLNTVNAADV